MKRACILLNKQTGDVLENIKLSGAGNVRDFGGIINAEGQRIRPHCFLRGSALHKLSARDAEKLTTQYRLQTVIDLRTNTEAEEKPDVKLPGVCYVHIPLIKESTAGISHENETDKKAALSNIPDLCALYQSIVTDPYSVAQMKKVFEVITNPGGGAILWHCTEGKDRAGLISALFLSMLDVGKDEIYADYLFTNQASRKNAAKYSALVFLISLSPQKARQIKAVFRADSAYLDAAFSAINRAHSGVLDFLKNEIGITDEVKARMKAKYLE